MGEAKDVSVKTITIQKAKLPESLTFSTGEINWTAEKSISVLGCNTALTAKPALPSVPVMVAPATNILVDLELSVGGQIKVYNNLPVKRRRRKSGYSEGVNRTWLHLQLLHRPQQLVLKSYNERQSN